MKTKSPKKAAEKASKPTVRELAEALAVSIRRVSQLKNEGMPVETVASAIAWREARDQRRDATTDSAERLRLERIELVREQRAKIELENRRLRGELIEVNSVFSTSLHIHRQLRMRLTEGARNSLPPMLEGLSAVQISRVLQGWIDELLETLTQDYQSGRLIPDETDISQ